MKNATKRFGHNVNLERCVGSLFIRLVAMVLFIIVLPLQLLFEGTFQSLENNNLIIPLQRSLPGECKNRFEYCNLLVSIPIYITSSYATSIIIIILSLSTDSLIAFKTALTLNFGIMILCFFEMIYKDGRPFWNSMEILSNQFCFFDFGSPN